MVGDLPDGPVEIVRQEHPAQIDRHGVAIADLEPILVLAELVHGAGYVRGEDLVHVDRGRLVPHGVGHVVRRRGGRERGGLGDRIDGRDVVLHERAVRLRGDKRPVDLIPRGTVAVEAVVEHRLRHESGSRIDEEIDARHPVIVGGPRALDHRLGARRDRHAPRDRVDDRRLIQGVDAVLSSRSPLGRAVVARRPARRQGVVEPRIDQLQGGAGAVGGRRPRGEVVVRCDVLHDA
jgi:hypothetical protein